MAGARSVLVHSCRFKLKFLSTLSLSQTHSEHLELSEVKDQTQPEYITSHIHIENFTVWKFKFFLLICLMKIFTFQCWNLNKHSCLKGNIWFTQAYVISLIHFLSLFLSLICITVLVIKKNIYFPTLCSSSHGKMCKSIRILKFFYRTFEPRVQCILHLVQSMNWKGEREREREELTY